MSSQTPRSKVYIGDDRAIVVRLPEDDTPSWVVRKFERMARQEGLTYYEFLDKYDPPLNPQDWDDAASAFEAWA